MYNIVSYGTTASTELMIHRILPNCVHHTAQSLAHAIALSQEVKAPVIIIELEHPDEQLMQLPANVQGADIVILSPPLHISQVMDLSRLCAHRYVPLPLEKHSLKKAVMPLIHRMRRQTSASGFIGTSQASRNIRKLISLYARTDEPVLITGETGTGKEVAAQMLHQLSSPQHPCLPLNCSSLSASLVESSLFGHAKGAFTDAFRDNQGFFESAGEGTLFLDEVGDLHQSVQPKLLRALENRKIYRVGDSTPITVSARIIAAAQDNLFERVQSGAFRRDLYYRVSTLRISIPPLRQRREDILPLIRCLLLPFPYMELSSQAIDLLTAYHWPGNVRELINILTRIRVLYPPGRQGQPVTEAQVSSILDDRQEGML